MPNPRLLIVDDEDGIRFGVRDYLESHGFDVDEAESCATALHPDRPAPDVAIFDYRLGDGTALDLLPRFRELHGDVPVLVLTAYGSIDLAVKCVKEGAEQFLTKPVEMPALLALVQRVLSLRRERVRQQAGRRRETQERVDPFLGESAAIRDLARAAERVAAADRPVLLLGETGTGKGVLARWLHEHGARAAEPFVDINCAGLATFLLDSELFGHRRGSFTGASADKVGLLEVADRGTLFLDEIGDMEAPVQAKMLKVLEEQRFRRLGDTRDRGVDVRLIAATHRDLGAYATEGRFRQDLYFRINTLPLALPPLRERVEDIPVLARALLARLANEVGHTPVVLDEEAERALMRYAWPGNIRELRNVLERAVLLTDRGTLTRADLRFEPERAAAPGEQLTLAELERRHIAAALERADGKVEAAARALGIPRSTLYQKLKAIGLSSGTRKRNPKSGRK